MREFFLSPEALAAFVSTGIISLAPNLIFLLVPGVAAGDTPMWLTLGQAMAAGGLLGDVFLHTLTDHTDEATGLWVIAGFTLFLTADLLIRSLQEADSSSQHYCAHSHGHHRGGSISKATDDRAFPQENGSSHAKADNESSHTVVNRSAIVLNLAADALHNFTDGLAIGASYSLASSASQQHQNDTFWSVLKSHSRGGLATLSIFFHEVPHELGDFCTLVRAGYSKRQAIMAQLGTAVAAFCGTITAIAVSSEAWAERRLLWITAGGFLYLAGTTILPEVLEEDGRKEKSAGNGSRLFRFAQLLSFCAGISFLYMVARMEEAGASHGDSSHGHHHHHTHHHHSHEHADEHAEL